MMTRDAAYPGTWPALGDARRAPAAQQPPLDPLGQVQPGCMTASGAYCPTSDTSGCVSM